MSLRGEVGWASILLTQGGSCAGGGQGEALRPFPTPRPTYLFISDSSVSFIINTCVINYKPKCSLCELSGRSGYLETSAYS